MQVFQCRKKSKRDLRRFAYYPNTGLEGYMREPTWSNLGYDGQCRVALLETLNHWGRVAEGRDGGGAVLGEIIGMLRGRVEKASET